MEFSQEVFLYMKKVESNPEKKAYWAKKRAIKSNKKK